MYGYSARFFVPESGFALDFASTFGVIEGFDLPLQRRQNRALLAQRLRLVAAIASARAAYQEHGQALFLSQLRGGEEIHCQSERFFVRKSKRWNVDRLHTFSHRLVLFRIEAESGCQVTEIVSRVVGAFVFYAHADMMSTFQNFSRCVSPYFMRTYN